MTIDIDDIESRINAGIYGDDRMTDTGRDDAFAALAVLLAEVERLRAQRALDNDALARAWDEGRDTERAATVAWLREPGEYVDPACSRLADCIERGVARRERKP
jgi:hypothetical protein